MTRLHSIARLGDIETLRACLEFMGFDCKTLGLSMQNKPEIDRDAIIDLINDRLMARHTKNWKESDRIRDELDAMGIAIKDNKDGTTSWEVKR